MQNNSNFIRNNIFPILNFRKFIRIAIESFLWVFASIIASVIRYDGIIPKDKYINVLSLGILGAFVYFLNNIIFATYKTQLIRASFEEVIRMSLSISTTTLFLFSARLFFEFPNLPMLTPLLCGIISIMLQISFRILVSGRLSKKLFNQTNGI